MSRENQKRVLIIFIKYPDAGNVKTRLARDLGEKKAAVIYSELATAVMDKVSNSNLYKKLIFFEPPEMKNEFRKWLKSYDFDMCPQEGTSLGDRMENGFKKTFSEGACKAVIIGTDCVEITYKLIVQAFELLEETDVVIGPAEEGGYYLLGMNRIIPEIFRGIDWSTNRVLEQTIEKIKYTGFGFELLKTLNDIDTINDIDDELISELHGDLHILTPSTGAS